MIKNIYIDGLFMALSYEATKVFINKDDVIISFKKEGQEENKEIQALVEILGVKEAVGDYSIAFNFDLIVLEIHKGYNFKMLRKLGKDDIDKIWTIAMVDIDTLMTREVEAWTFLSGEQWTKLYKN